MQSGDSEAPADRACHDNRVECNGSLVNDVNNDNYLPKKFSPDHIFTDSNIGSF